MTEPQSTIQYSYSMEVAPFNGESFHRRDSAMAPAAGHISQIPPAARPPPPPAAGYGHEFYSDQTQHHPQHYQQQQQQPLDIGNPPLSAETVEDASRPTPMALMLQTAADAAAAQQPSVPNTSAPSPPDTVALEAMQEAASIVMEAHQRQQEQEGILMQQQERVGYPTYGGTGRQEKESNTPTLQAGSLGPSHQSGASRKRPGSSMDHSLGDEGQASSKTSRLGPARVTWEERIQQLKEYKEKHGDLLIPIRYKVSNLGKFVHNTREQYKLYHKQTPEGYKKKCSLTAARIQQLNDLGFAWTTERTKRQNDDWQRRLQQLRAFKARHGHCLVPHGYPEDPSFAEWIHRQRTSYNNFLRDDEQDSDGTDTSTNTPSKSNKAVNPMMKARFEQLKEMGFNFTVHSDKWMDHWRQLKLYKEKHGDCQVPTHYAENPKLGRWVHTQRHQRRLQAKGKKSCMTQERIDLLDQLGFSWEVRPSLERPRATWQQRLEELQAFHLEHGHFKVDPTSMPALNTWSHEQRHRLRLLEKNQGKDSSKRMNGDRVSALHSIGFTKDAELAEGAPPPKMEDAPPAMMDSAHVMDSNSFPQMDEQALGDAMVDAALDHSNHRAGGDQLATSGESTEDKSGTKLQEPLGEDKMQQPVELQQTTQADQQQQPMEDEQNQQPVGHGQQQPPVADAQPPTVEDPTATLVEL